MGDPWCVGEGVLGARVLLGSGCFGLTTFSQWFLNGPQQFRRRKMTGVSPAIKPGLPAQAVLLADESTR